MNFQAASIKRLATALVFCGAAVAVSAHATPANGNGNGNGQAPAPFTPVTLASGDVWLGVFDGNDCSGLFGQGFANCSYSGSPIIAKFNYNDGVRGQVELNTGTFGSITGDEFTISFFQGTTAAGTWTYNPGAGDPAIVYYVAKGGNGFNLFQNLGDPLTGTWFAGDNVNDTSPALSHLSFYDTGRPPIVNVSAPTPLALLSFGLIAAGLAASRRGKRAA